MTQLQCRECGHTEDKADAVPGAVYPCACGAWLRGPRLIRSEAHKEPFTFILSSSLGKLAAYLRMLGYDTLWERFDETEQVIARALSEQRILLTADKALQERINATDVILLTSAAADEQLRELCKYYSLKPHALEFARCTRCNVDLVGAADDQTAQQSGIDEVWECPLCEKSYRESTYQRLMERLF